MRCTCLFSAEHTEKERRVRREGGPGPSASHGTNKPGRCKLWCDGHGRVWTSTERTAGRSWTMADHVSPPLGET